MRLRNAVLSLFAVLSMSLLSGCGYNTIQTQDQTVKAAWAWTTPATASFTVPATGLAIIRTAFSAPVP